MNGFAVFRNLFFYHNFVDYSTNLYYNDTHESKGIE